MTNMMEGVLNFGTAFDVRGKWGFQAPAAGKTGSSHDGWFAGYTSNLLCIVWVGYDDYSDIRLSGAQTAAPVWAAFIKKAVALPLAPLPGRNRLPKTGKRKKGFSASLWVSSKTTNRLIHRRPNHRIRTVPRLSKG